MSDQIPAESTEDFPLHPDGRECEDCDVFKLCKWFVGREGTERTCDWSPSRFRLPQVQP